MDISRIAFQRKPEPRENAFTILVPEGWLLEGGIVRADHMRQLVSAQSIAAKLDIAVKKDEQGTVMVRGCPTIQYADPRFLLVPPMGNTYMGALLHPLLSPAEFLTQLLFPWAHPEARGAEIAEQQELPEWADGYRQRQTMSGFPAGYEAGTVTFLYTEGGVAYREVAATVIQSLQPLSSGWSNIETSYYRAPVHEFLDWEPVLLRIKNSVQNNEQWLAMEQVNQEFLSMAFLNAQQAEQWRAMRALQVQQEINAINRRMMEHRYRAYDRTRWRDHYYYRVMQPYWNPYLHQMDFGARWWPYRWVTPRGDEFYGSAASDDPNQSRALDQDDWAQSEAREDTEQSQ